MRSILLISLMCCAEAIAAEPVRVLLSVGNNIGDPDDVPLRFAETDAQRFLDLMVDIGQVKSDRASLAVGLDAHGVREKLSELKGRLAELAAAGRETLLILYVSAHAQGGDLHLRGTHLPLRELREFGDSTAAQMKLVIIDACESGLLRRSKGVKPGKDFTVDVQATVTKGQVLISSSSEQEASQEWELLQGSLFTHHLLTGLRGDADVDGDGQITMTEAYQYTWRRTVAQAAGTQHPNFDFDITGSTDVMVTRPKLSRASVFFPPELTGRFVVSSQPRPDVVTELNKQGGQGVRLALRPGRYVVRYLKGATVGLKDFELPFGGQFVVEPKEFQMHHYAEIATKGGYVQVRPHQIALGVAAESPQLLSAGPRVRAEIQFRRALDHWLVGLGVGVGYWRFRGVSLQTEEWTVQPWVEAGYRFFSTFWTPIVGLRAGADLRHQSSRRDQEVAIQQLGYAAPPARWSLGALLGPFLGLELSLSERWLLGARLLGEARWLNAENQPPWTFVVQGSVYGGWKF